MVSGRLDGRRFVFVDECSTNTSLSPIYGWSRRGSRVRLEAPHNWEADVTLLSSMSAEGMGPSLAVEGSITKVVFEAYAERVLAPSLWPGQMMVMDNLSAHKGGRVREIVEEAGCDLLLFVPAYSPDLNPIEEAFSKLKASLRRAGARTREALLEAMGLALDTVTASDAWGFFEHRGYCSLAQPL